MGRSVICPKGYPRPDNVDEFIYEVLSLQALRRCPRVVNLVSIVTDIKRQIVKGYLIDFAQQAALVDILYDFKGTMAWARRERWEVQIVEGLADIHACGFIHGGLTLSDIVVDGSDNAIIIDINRSGCPVGWEPREIIPMLCNNLRISMFIGQKSDLFQIGMVLWALAEGNDEPEMVKGPLKSTRSDIPWYYRDMVSCCLSDDPLDRQPANALLAGCPQL
jgi:serine/threonine protein kinase